MGLKYLLIKLLNIIFITISQSWKHGRVVMIPKPDEFFNFSNADRLITLLSRLSGIFQKFILFKINSLLNDVFRLHKHELWDSARNFLPENVPTMSYLLLDFYVISPIRFEWIKKIYIISAISLDIRTIQQYNSSKYKYNSLLKNKNKNLCLFIVNVMCSTYNLSI